MCDRFGDDVQHAHGYVPQVMADLGWFGLVVSLAATLAWLLSAAGVVGLRRRDRGLTWDAERVGMAGLAVTALVFGAAAPVTASFVNGRQIVEDGRLLTVDEDAVAASTREEAQRLARIAARG